MATKEKKPTAGHHLPDEIWQIVGTKLEVEGRKCFRAVCKTWRYFNLTIRQPPWLMLDHYRTIRGHRNFISMGDRDAKELAFPYPDMRCLGCTGTWLITTHHQDRNRIIRLIAIQLPNHLPLAVQINLPMINGDVYLKKVILSSNPPNTNCRAVAICGYSRQLAFARLGDPSWAVFEPPGTDSVIQDVIFYKERCYGVTQRGMVIVCDVVDGLNPPDALILKDGFGLRSGERYLDASVLMDGFGDATGEHYLVEWCGEILIVIQHLSPFERDKYKVGFEVYKVDVTNKKPTLLKSLGDYALFVGAKNTSMSLLAADYSGLQRNCIYFAGCSTYWFSYGVFSMKDKTVQLKYENQCTSAYLPHVWVVPT